MNDNVKATPGGIPPDPTPLAAKVGAARAAPKDPTDLRVTLDMEGGSMEDRYEFHFEGSGAGDIQVKVRDRLRQLDIPPRAGQVEPGDMTEVFTSLEVGQMMALSRSMAPIPPDSTVGILTVSDGRQEAMIVFMADEGQAETAGFELPEDLRRAVDKIFEIGAKQVELESVRP
ncbi:MAG: hypothetical protein ACRDZM_06095 [Acidimicrobiia bacterium]